MGRWCRSRRDNATDDRPERALPVSFDYELLSRAVVHDDYVLYQYIVFPVDQGPGYQYPGASRIYDLFPDGQSAHDSVDWGSLQVYSNLALPSELEALFRHGELPGPAGIASYWGDRWYIPATICSPQLDKDGASFLNAATYDWSFFGYRLRIYANDPCDPFLAFSFRSRLPPELGTWHVEGQGFLDTGANWVPGVHPSVDPPTDTASVSEGEAVTWALLGIVWLLTVKPALSGR